MSPGERSVTVILRSRHGPADRRCSLSGTEDVHLNPTRITSLAPALALLLLGGAPAPALAGAWTAAPRALYLKLSYVTSSANDQFGFGGRPRPIVDGVSDYPFADRSAYLYAEYGLKEGLTAIGQLPFKRLFVHDRFFRYQTTGAGDLGVGLRYRLFNRGAWVGSAGALVNVPTGYSPRSRPPLGAGVLELTGGFELGRSFYPRPGYATVGLACVYRSSASVAGPAGEPTTVNFADQLRYSLETGWTIRNRVTLRAQLHGVHAFRSDGTAFSITSIPSSERYLKIGGGAAYRISPHLELSADAGTTPSGRNTAQSVDLALGVATSW